MSVCLCQAARSHHHVTAAGTAEPVSCCQAPHGSLPASDICLLCMDDAAHFMCLMLRKKICSNHCLLNRYVRYAGLCKSRVDGFRAGFNWTS
jgi:hypothetical protein